ncbi:MAG: T9SS type A sorting domain-containing protein [Saprospiraceae bacterium]
MAFTVSQLDAQIPTFIKHHGTPGDDEARFVEVLPDNSFIVAGSSTEGGLGGKDAMLVKFRADGTVEWSKAYGGPGDEFFMHILACSDGNYIAVGETNSFGAGNVDIYVVKFDGKGDVVWVRTCGGAGIETARGICEVSNGYILSGATQSFGVGSWDIFVEKLNFGGNSLWSKAFGGGGGDVAGEVGPAANGEAWVSGFVFVSSGNHDAVLFKLASNGNLLLARRASAFSNDGFAGLSEVSNGLVACGGTSSFSGDSPWVVNFNTTGALVWAKRYPISGVIFDLYAEPCPDGGLILTPSNFVGEDTDGSILIKTNEVGIVTWSMKYSYGSKGKMWRTVPSPDGGYVAVGYCYGKGRDMLVFKTDADGFIRECSPTDAGITAIAITPGAVAFSPVTSTGPSAGAPAAEDQSVALTETIICDLVSTVSQDPSLVLSLVPNPTSSVFRFLSSEQIPLDIRIFDSAGRLCFTSKTQTNQDVEPPNRLSSGMYIVYVTASDGRVRQFRMARE